MANLKPYITRIAKENDYFLTGQARTVVEDLIVSATEDLTYASHLIMELAKRNTITLNVVTAAVSIIYKGELLVSALDAGNNAVNTFNDNSDEAYNRKEAQAGLSLSVSRVRSLIKQHSEQYSVSDQAVIYVAGVLEYLIGELLSVANGFKQNKRITSDNVASATENDIELAIVFNRLI